MKFKMVTLFVIFAVFIRGSVSDYQDDRTYLKVWDLENKIFALTQGLARVDGELEYLYAKLPDKVLKAGQAITASRNMKNLQNKGIVGANVFGTIIRTVGSNLNKVETGSDFLFTDAFNIAGSALQNGAYSGGILYGIRQNSPPTCGVDSFKRTWTQFRDVSSLRNAYSNVFRPFHSVKRRSVDVPALEYLDWTPVLTSEYNDLYSSYNTSSTTQPTIQPVYQPSIDRNYKTGGVLDRLSPKSVPAYKEVRMLTFMTVVRRDLSCLLDEKVAASRQLSEHLLHIENTSIARLRITQKIIDLNVKLENMKEGQSGAGYNQHSA